MVGNGSGILGADQNPSGDQSDARCLDPDIVFEGSCDVFAESPAGPRHADHCKKKNRRKDRFVPIMPVQIVVEAEEVDRDEGNDPGRESP